MGPPKDALDVAIRLFLLGLALPRAQAERVLGGDFLESADRLGMLAECPVDPLLLVSLVQLFPLDAEALLPTSPPPPPLPPDDNLGQDSDEALRTNHGAESSSDGKSNNGDGTPSDSEVFDGGDAASGRGSAENTSLGGGGDSCSNGRDEAPPLAPGGFEQNPEGSGDAAAAVVQRKGDPHSREKERGGMEGCVPAETVAAAATPTSVVADARKAAGVVAPSDLIFATDWPPPGSTAMTEEPVSGVRPPAPFRGGRTDWVYRSVFSFLFSGAATQLPARIS